MIVSEAKKIYDVYKEYKEAKKHLKSIQQKCSYHMRIANFVEKAQKRYDECVEKLRRL